MLQEAKDLQRRAVEQLLEKVKTSRRELTFSAPTGSGKTRMMADFMNRVLAQWSDVVFLVSTLSKSELGRQNYDTFKKCADDGTFPKLNPYLINTEVSGEEGVFIPTDFNVYVLQHDLYKKGGRLMQGAMINFLKTMTNTDFDWGLKKKIWLIKDESHVATNKLDDQSEMFFSKVLNFSATPNRKRGQVPDVEITEDEAEEACLIKDVKFEDDPTIPVDTAIDKLLEIKADYSNLLNTNPCLIIQISNREKAQQEWEQKIKPAIDRHQELKWMYIVNKEKECDTNDDVKRRLPVKRWKDYAKEKDALIDIIVFKMVITEGWDIPRACMLYQVRDTKSKQLDRQVVGRVRRNPRLSDYETLSPEAQKLAMKAWVWGIKPENMRKSRQVTLWKNRQNEIRQNFKVTTTRLSDFGEKKDFDVKEIVERKPKAQGGKNIFRLWRKLSDCPDDVQNLCYEYAGGNPQRWFRFMDSVDEVCKAYDDYICNYDESIEIDKEVSFPATSSYLETEQLEKIDSWIWCRKDGSSDQFTFDSVAERLWADILKACQKDMARIEDKDLFGCSTRFLWGKNFPVSSEIKYQYYLHGKHYSYPDFVMKDTHGRIHIFEVKSVNKSRDMAFINDEEYEAKVAALRTFYKHCSAKVKNHIFYIPILNDEGWNIYRYIGGEEDPLNEEMFRDSLKKDNIQGL